MYATNTHSTTTTQLYNHIPSSTNRALTPTADFTEAEENTKSNDNDDQLSWKEVSEGDKKKKQVPEGEKGQK
jgi:hypothetical protein